MKRCEWVGAHFERSVPWLQAALASHPLETHTIDHVRDALESGNCQLWATDGSAAVVEVVEHPTGLRTLHHWLAGGDLDQLRHTAATVENYARANGFGAITISGRAGWSRALPGYRPASTLIVKDLR